MSFYDQTNLRKSVFLSLILVALLVFFIPNVHSQEESNVKFEERENMYWLMIQSKLVFYPCPEDISVEGIKMQIEDLEPWIASGISEGELTRIQITCASYRPNETNYKFESPPDIFWLVRQHMYASYPCPDTRDISKLRLQIEKNNPLILSKMTDDDLAKIEKECADSGFYSLEGIAPESEIEACFNHLNSLVKEKELFHSTGALLSNSRYLYRECYIRQYFEQRYNNTSITRENITLLYKQRDLELLEFLKYKNEYPRGFGLGKSVYDNGTEIPPVEELPASCTEEMKAHPEKYDCYPVITLHDKIPAPEMRQTIRERIGAFFDWFK